MELIKCSDKLPELPNKGESKEYLVLCDDLYLIASWQRDYINGGYIEKEKCYAKTIYKDSGHWKIHQCDEHDCNFEDEITHWFELPEKPEEE